MFEEVEKKEKIVEQCPPVSYPDQNGNNANANALCLFTHDFHANRLLNHNVFISDTGDPRINKQKREKKRGVYGVDWGYKPKRKRNREKRVMRITCPSETWFHRWNTALCNAKRSTKIESALELERYIRLDTSLSFPIFILNFHDGARDIRLLAHYRL